MPEIMFLAPYAKMAHDAHKILSERDVEFEVIEVPPLECEEVVKGIGKHVQVIISRGGMAKLAKHFTSVPVIEIPVTLPDILDTIGPIADRADCRKVIISTADIICDPKFISKIRGLNIDFLTSADCFITCQDWVAESIQSQALAHGEGNDIIIGDAFVCAVAAKHGFNGVLIESSAESLSLAIDEAMRIVETNRHGSQLLISRRKELLEKGWVAHYSFRDILGQGSDLGHAVEQARLFAKSDGTVLVEGETGTGKELFAQSIHNESDRVYGPFVSVNCSAISDTLFESELFGYDSGAFTGANKGGKRGLFECAQNGTIFLDEISETSMNLQAKLLRVLQERTLRRVGSNKIIDLDARIICATNKNLLELAEQGKFRKDLYYRLSELELYLPPLRERRDDVLTIAENILPKEADKINRKVFWKDRGIFEPLLSYEWPGNIRELRNFIVKLATYAQDGEITSEFVKAVFLANYRKAPKEKENELTVAISSDFKIMEREIFTKLLALYDGDRDRLCRQYGFSKPTLWRKLSYKKKE